MALTSKWSDFKLAGGRLDQIGVDAVVVDAAGGQSHVQGAHGVHLVLQSHHEIILSKNIYKSVPYCDGHYDCEVVADVDFFQVVQRELQIVLGLALQKVCPSTRVP